MSKRVLIVTYIFPPAGGAGVQRVAKFVKYLPKFGWEPIVLTVANSSVPLLDRSLLKDIPPDTIIHKAATLEPPYAVKQYVSSGNGNKFASLVRSKLKNLANTFLLPDVQVLWWPNLSIHLVKLLKQNQIDCVFSSAPPFSTLVPTVFIANKFKLPVIIDFRDEWSFTRTNFENSIKSPIACKVDKFLEEYVVANCNLFTAATQSYIDSICAKYPSVDPSRGISITNGFDLDDFCSTGNFAAKDKLEIVYTGTIWKATSLEKFSTALLNIAKLKPELADQLRLRIVGRIVGNELQHISALKSCIDVEITGYLSHETIINMALNADVLLLTLSNLRDSHKIIPGKTFEYMATGNHIFAIAPDGETKTIIAENYPNATFADPDSVEDIQTKLEYLLSTIRTKPQSACSGISFFSREALTHRLADVLDTAVSGSL
ncbi:glycosyltransferase [Desulfocurvibacter africanus]|uniref:glycosyltransferase n=1 Tax=Desulfocurvibacter africanus TaxID=873 RepID=UPI00041355F2|nr:glycosyltransferase [Desulfocurvibacter africanus]